MIISSKVFTWLLRAGQPSQTQLHSNGHPMTFKIDTGADITVVSERERESQRSLDGKLGQP